MDTLDVKIKNFSSTQTPFRDYKNKPHSEERYLQHVSREIIFKLLQINYN